MTQIFEYNDSPISFYKKNGMTYMNAVEMSKPFGKHPKHWLANNSTNDFLSELSKVRNLTSSDLVRVTYGNKGGTWMHEDAALEYARWLNPAFAIWCNDKIKELLQQGVVTIDSLSMKDVAKMLYESEVEKERLQADLKLAAPKADYFDKVIQSNEAIRTTVIAKDLGMSAKSLNQILHKMGIQYRLHGTWVLYAKYQDKEYTKSVTHQFELPCGEIGTNIQMCWTQKGREFIMKYVPGFIESLPK